MPSIRFQPSTTDSFGAPGVYVKQLAVPAPLRGVFLGTTGFVGKCVKGPVNKLVRCDSYQRFIDVFGGRDYGVNGGAVVGDVWWALQCKQWGTFYVVRAAAAAAVAASFDAETAAGGGGTAVLHIVARSVGAWGNNVAWKVLAASNGVATSFNLAIQDRNSGRNYLHENLSINGSDDNLAATVGGDDATPIVLTKLASGRPVNNAANTDGADANGYTLLGQTVAAFTSVAGSDGAIADTDYTAAGGPMETLHGARGIDYKAVAGRSNTAIKTKVYALAPTANLSAWGICPDDSTVTDTTWETEVATYRDRHIFPVFNHPTYVDPVTGAQAVGEPHIHLGSVLSQTLPDVHPGVSDTAPLNTGIVSLAFSLTDAQRDALDAAGSTFLNQDLDENNNFVWLFGNGRTADLTVNNSQIDGERSKNYLISGLAQRMRGDQNKPNTATARAKRKGAFSGWLTELAEAERFVQKDSNGNPSFLILNNDEVNTPADWAAGIQRDLVQIQLIPKNLYLQLQVEAGTDVTITQQPQS